MTATEPVAGDFQPLIDRWRADPQSSARVLLTTVMGDAVRPRRQAVDVKSLARLMEPLGINERSVRTALLRLSRESLVSGRREGRRSFYSVAPEAVATFDQADDRIYRRSDSSWDGLWTVAVVDAEHGDPADRRRLVQELGWLGLGRVADGVFISPTVTTGEVVAVAERSEARLLLVTHCRPETGPTLDGVALASRLAAPDDLEPAYRLHVDTFSPVVDLIDDGRRPSPVEAFIIRTVLINRWRRLALRDLDLPERLTPANWPGVEARRLTGSIYRALLVASEQHLDDVVGPAPNSTERDRQLAARFTE